MIRKLVIEKEYGMLGEFDVYLDTLGYKPGMNSNLKSNEGGVFSMELYEHLPGHNVKVYSGGSLVCVASYINETNCGFTEESGCNYYDENDDDFNDVNAIMSCDTSNIVAYAKTVFPDALDASFLSLHIPTEHMAALLPGTQVRLIDHNKQSVDGLVGVIYGSKDAGRSSIVVLLDGEKHPVPMLRGR